MSAFPSTYLQEKVLEHVLDNTAFTSPTTVYLGLYTSNPNADDSGTEVTGGSYARQALSFAAFASGEISSDTEETFSSLPTATITHYSIHDASTAGNLLIYGALPNTVTTNTGDDVVIASGDIDFTFGGS